MGTSSQGESVILSAPGLFVSSLLYLLLLFFVAYATERRWVPTWVPRHPAIYILSLGVYATTWSFYGSVGYADSNGFMFLTVYLGLTLAFILTPVLLSPFCGSSANTNSPRWQTCLLFAFAVKQRECLLPSSCWQAHCLTSRCKSKQ